MKWQRKAAAYPKGKPLSTPAPGPITLDALPAGTTFDSSWLIDSHGQVLGDRSGARDCAA